MDFAPTPAFWISLLPLPILVYLNAQVARLLIEIRRKSRSKSLHYPRLYHEGQVLGVISACFAITPALVEWRIFVLNPLWALSYLTGGLLGILALRMTKRGLEQELRRIQVAKRRSSHKK